MLREHVVRDGRDVALARATHAMPPSRSNGRSERVAIHPMALVALNAAEQRRTRLHHARASSMDTALADAAATLLERWPDTAPDAGRTRQCRSGSSIPR